MTLTLPEPTQPARPTASGAAQRSAYRHWQQGRLLVKQQRWPAAAAAFERADGLHADEAYGLAAAHALMRCGRPADAARRARRLRQQRPQQMLGYTIESLALTELGRPEEAVQCLRALPGGIVPDRPYLVSLAMALQKTQRHGEAVPVFLQALGLKMDDGSLHFHLGMSLKVQGMKAEAAECVRTAVMLGLGRSELVARGQLVFLEREACRWAEAEAELASLRPALRALPPLEAIDASAFAHAVLVDDPLEQLKVSRHYALYCATKTRPLPRVRAREHGGRLRVGYLSADFHTHATSQLMVQVLECHDRQQFEITCLSTGLDDRSALRQRLVAAVEHFVDLQGSNHQQVADKVRSLGIDILVDLKGATQDCLLPVMACRAAPLQVAWLGFPGSTGAPYIDYLIGDPVVTPLGHAAHFSEKIAQLPHCYQPNDAHRTRPRPATRAEWSVPDDALLLCAFHQSYKISADVFDTWCRLLAARPDALLWLLEWNSNVSVTLRAAARARGIDDRRLVFAPVVPLQQHLSRLALADIYLDAWPCNAHTTAGEALWVGVPVVTLCGNTFAQRVAASLLHAVRLDELVCHDTNDYCAKVLALAGDTPRRHALKAQLAGQQRTSPLFDGAAFARDLEALLQRMWRNALQGAAAEHLPAEVRA